MQKIRKSPRSINNRRNNRRSFNSSLARSAIALPFLCKAGVVAAIARSVYPQSALADVPDTPHMQPVEPQRNATAQTGPNEQGNNYGPDRVLSLLNVHTGETFEGPYWSGGRFVASGMAEINALLRDFRIDEIHVIDPMVIDFMHSIYQQLDTVEPIQILSGYRSPATNAKLAESESRVAKNSLHMQGKAIDFRVPGSKAKKLQEIALSLKSGGVGYYQKSDFIHIDTGPFRHWG